MIWIELMGPSGVGKSYCYQKLMEAAPELNPAHTLFKRIVESEYFRAYPFYIKVCALFAKWNFKPSGFKNIVINFTLKRVERFKGFSFDEKDDHLVKCYLGSIFDIKENAVYKLKKIEYFSKSLLLFKTFEYFLKEDDLYIAEDGILHQCHDFFSPELIKLPNKIYCLSLPEDLILKNRLKRKKKGNSTFLELIATGDELEKYVKQYNKAYNSKVSLLRNLNRINVMDFRLESGNNIESLLAATKDLAFRPEKSQ